MLAPGGVPREGEAHNVASSIDVCAGWAGRRVGAAWAARSGVPAEKMLGGKKRGGRGRHGGGGGRSGEDLKRSAWAPMYGGAGLSSSSSSSSTSSNGHGRRQVLGRERERVVGRCWRWSAGRPAESARACGQRERSVPRCGGTKPHSGSTGSAPRAHPPRPGASHTLHTAPAPGVSAIFHLGRSSPPPRWRHGVAEQLSALTQGAVAGGFAAASASSNHRPSDPSPPRRLAASPPRRPLAARN